MTDVLSQPAAHALARALGHFVWQGAAIGLMALIAFRVFRASASARYLIGVTGLVAMLAAPITTFVMLVNEPVAADATPITAPLTSGVAPASQVAAVTSIASSNQIDWQAAVLLAWMIGAVAFTLRLTGGWIVARRFATRAVQPASGHIANVVRQLADRMDVRRAIAVVESAAVSVPVMIGWLKPTIVLPIAALAGLSPSQIEALIAHELAHVKRHDYLVNLLQSTVEALLFYHPAVWWLSRRVRAERELCCDDLAVRVCDRLVYATALTDLASMSSPRIALAATDGDLLDRVRRILNRGQSSPAAWPGVAPLLALAFVAAVVVPAALASAPPQHPAAVALTTFGDETGALPQTTPTPSTSPSPKPTTAPALPGTKGETLSAAEWEALVKQQLQSLYEKQIAEQWNTAEIDKAFQQTVEQSKVEREAAVKALQQDLERMQKLQEKGLATQQQVERIREAMEKVAAQGDERASREAELKALQQQLERMRTLQEKGLASQSQVEEIKALLDKAAGQGNQQAAREAELKAMKQQLERTQELFQKGLVAQSQLEEVKAAVAKAAAQGSETAERAAALREAQIQLERAKTLFDKGLTTAAAVSQVQDAVATAERQLLEAQRQNERTTQMAAESKAAADRLQADARSLRASAQQSPQPTTQTFYLSYADAQEVAQILNQMLSGRSDPSPTIVFNRESKTLTATASAPILALIKNLISDVDKPKSETGNGQDRKLRVLAVDQATPAQVRDTLSIAISGEPDLPKTYVIAEDGTVRLPFIGSVKVVGLTASQAREAIGKRLAEKKLGSIDQVTVKIMRAQ